MAASRDRCNAEWLAELAREGSEGERARAELRELVRRGLARALRERPEVDDDALEDFTQDAMVKILTNLDSFRGDSKLTTWAMTIAVRTAASDLRRARWRDIRLEELTIDPAAVSDSLDPATSAHWRKMVQVLRDVVDQELTARQRLALLSELDGVPVAVLVERLGVTRNTFYKLIHDARTKLRAALLARVDESDVRAFFEE